MFGVLAPPLLVRRGFLPRLLPGDPMEILIGEESIRLSAEQRTAVLAQFGLDRPLLAQYGAYWRGITHLDLGTSVGYGAAFEGLAPLLTMLNSCAPGVAVVNIDNGYGAGHMAAQIAAPVPE